MTRIAVVTVSILLGAMQLGHAEPKDTKAAQETNADKSGAPSYKPGNGHMRHCPTAVDGAKSEVTNTKTGVDILVTASDKPAVSEIRSRAKYMAGIAKAGSPEGTPDGEGHGGGGHGRCPVVVKDTKVTASDVKNGVKIQIRPTQASAVAELQKTVAERNAAARPATNPAAPH